MTKLFDLAGRKALITGGSKGLGKQIARGLAEAGADVFISSRHEDELKAALAEILQGIESRGGYAVADMAKREDVKRLAAEAVQQMGRVDILVNNAGTNRPQPVADIVDEDWDAVMEINLNSVMVLTRELAPPMRERGWGRIIHVSSIFGMVSKEGRHVYSATKSALHGFAKSAAIELAGSGVTVNCVAPGPFLTDLPMRVFSEEQKREMADMTAMKRWGDPREIAGPVLLLASDAGSYMTGSTVVVDGGYTAK